MAEKLWEHGGSQFWSGDARDVVPQMSGKAALGLFDPPYGIDWHAAGHDGIEFDKNPWLAARTFVPLMTSALADDAVFAAFSSQRVESIWTRQMGRCGLAVQPTLVWDKGSAWHRQRGSTPEVLLVGFKGHPAVTLEDLVLQCAVPRDKETKENSPTPKPDRLCDLLIRKLSKPGDFVVDLCAGAGPIGRAALSRDRRYLGVEYEDPRAKYAVERLKLTVARRDAYRSDTNA